MKFIGSIVCGILAGSVLFWIVACTELVSRLHSMYLSVTFTGQLTATGSPAEFLLFVTLTVCATAVGVVCAGAYSVTHPTKRSIALLCSTALTISSFVIAGLIFAIPTIELVRTTAYISPQAIVSAGATGVGSFVVLGAVLGTIGLVLWRARSLEPSLSVMSTHHEGQSHPQ